MEYHNFKEYKEIKPLLIRISDLESDNEFIKSKLKDLETAKTDLRKKYTENAIIIAELDDEIFKINQSNHNKG